MLDAVTPTGALMHIPETLEEDKPHFGPDCLAEARTFYEEQGYVVLRGLVPADLCARIRGVFDSSVRASRVAMLRQKNMRYERNAFDEHGFLQNPIFNVQDLGSRALGAFRDAVLDVLTHRATAAATASLLDTERTKVIQSMFFEAPAGTWAHQDSYYQDSAAGLGGCAAGWFALEDIDAGAGRFYVCPGSHRSMSPLRNAGAHNFATGHQAYQQAMVEAMRSNDLPLSAPFLAAGDVLFWNSLTVHGSLPASRPGVSRMSLTAHYLREDDAMLQFHSRIREQKTKLHGGTMVGLLHDQDLLRNQVVREVAFHFPKSYMTARGLALQALLAKRRTQQKLGLSRHAGPSATGTAPEKLRKTAWPLQAIGQIGRTASGGINRPRLWRRRRARRPPAWLPVDDAAVKMNPAGGTERSGRGFRWSGCGLAGDMRRVLS